MTLTSAAFPEAFIEQLRRLDISVAGVAYEAGPTGFLLARALVAEKIPVTMAAPGSLNVPKRYLAQHGANKRRITFNDSR